MKETKLKQVHCRGCNTPHELLVEETMYLHVVPIPAKDSAGIIVGQWYMAKYWQKFFGNPSRWGLEENVEFFICEKCNNHIINNNTEWIRRHL